MTKVWQTGDLIDAAHMNDLAQVSDIGTAGTPTGNALKAAIDAQAADPTTGIAAAIQQQAIIYAIALGG